MIGIIFPMLVEMDPWLIPKQVDHAVLGQVGPVVHEDQKNPVPRVQGERAARAHPAHPARVLEPLSLGLRIGLFDVSHQKIDCWRDMPIVV